MTVAGEKMGRGGKNWGEKMGRGLEQGREIVAEERREKRGENRERK